MARLHFYVPDYPAVKEKLDAAYVRYGVEEWAAEPGRVGDREDDADVTVDGDEVKLLDFTGWLDDSNIEHDEVEQ